MPRLSQTERRRAIIDATLVVTQRKGIGATTARDVALEMGTSSGLIHHYFASMDDLFAAAFAQAATDDLNQTSSAVYAATSATDKLAAFFVSYERTDDEWGYQIWLDAWSEAPRRPMLQATSQRLNLAWHALLVSIIDLGVRDGAFHCAEPTSTAWRILALLDGLSLQVVAHPEALQYEVVMPWSMRLAELEIGLTPGTLQSR